MGKFSKKYYYNNFKVAFNSDYNLHDFIKDSYLENAKIISVTREDKNHDGDYEYSIIFKLKLDK
jgi:hypothetical protein